MVEKLFLDPFLKTQNEAYPCVNSLKFHTVCFHCMLSWGLLKYETKLQATCFFLIKSFFKKQKEVWNYSPLLNFCMIFQVKCFSCNILLADQISLSGWLLFARYCAICVLQLFINQVVTPLILKLSLYF